MLKGKCINPLIISALAHCGHGDKLLIADGNYPIDTMTADAETVYLSLSPGLPPRLPSTSARLGAASGR